MMAMMDRIAWTLCLAAVSVAGHVCHISGRNDSKMVANHILQDSHFWKHFEQQVRSRSWKCDFQSEVLSTTVEKDAALYKDDSVLRKRRIGVRDWLKNDTLWVTVVLGACKELASERTGIYSRQLQSLHMLEALEDFVEHLNCFYVVASRMAAEGQEVKPLSQASSQIHDIDKLDPIMLVGYSERFEDNVSTSVWDLCVQRHTRVNPHHQAHCVWHDCCESCPPCEDYKTKALAEMVCDKVSRRLQKNLNGSVCKDMWNVDMSFFNGLPQDWLNKATALLENMKLHMNHTKEL